MHDEHLPLQHVQIGEDLGPGLTVSSLGADSWVVAAATRAALLAHRSSVVSADLIRPGDELEEVARRQLPRTLALAPHVVTLLLWPRPHARGTWNALRYATQLRQIVHELLPVANVIITGCPPSTPHVTPRDQAALNAWLADLAGLPGVTLLHPWTAIAASTSVWMPDGLSLTPAAAQQLGTVIGMTAVRTLQPKHA